MTTSRFRTLVVAYAVTYSWYFALAYNVGKLPEDVQPILQYAGYGAVIPSDSPLYFVPFILALIACAGLLMLARWGRTLLLVSIVTAILLVPFMGMSVEAPFDVFVSSIAGVLGAALLGIAYSSPIAEQLSRAGAASEERNRRDTTGPTPDERVIEVFRSSDESLLAVLESVLAENDIPFSLAGETLQDLFAGGRLGGHNFAIGPARLFVRERDAENVREILAELQVPMRDGENRGGGA